MIAPWLVYAVLVSATLGLAALVLERALQAVRLPVRLAWVGAMAGSVLLPAVMLLRPPVEAPAPPPGPASVLVMAPLEIAAHVPAAAPLLLDRPFQLVWVLTSLLLACFVALSARVLARRRRAWRRAVVAGEAVEVSRDVGPAVVGFVHSAIVLPEWALEAGADRLELLVAHEKEHLRAHDGRLLALALGLAVLLPWNLPLWWQLRRLRLAVELDCDARVVHRRSDLRAYAHLLLDIGSRSGRGLLPVLAFARSESFLERRLRIMTMPTPRARWARLAGGGAVAVLITLGACELRSPAEPVSQTPPREVPVEPQAAEAAVPGAVDRDGPVFTPMTVRPDLTNRDELAHALRTYYPPLLRDAGIGGTASVWFHIDETGRVAEVRIHKSSGHEALDDAALQVASVMRFTPAENKGERVPVWMAIPIAFTADVGAQKGARERPLGGGADERTFRTDGIGAADWPALVNRHEVMNAMVRNYPPLLRDAGIGGTVAVSAFIDAAGKASRVQIKESSGRRELDEAALRVVDVMRFRPAGKDGAPTATWLKFPVVFTAK